MSIDDGAGDRRAAWITRANRYDGISNAGHVASCEVLYNSKLQPGSNPGIWLHAIDGLRDHLQDQGEVITDQHIANVIMLGLPD